MAYDVATVCEGASLARPYKGKTARGLPRQPGGHPSAAFRGRVFDPIHAGFLEINL